MFLHINIFMCQCQTSMHMNEWKSWFLQNKVAHGNSGSERDRPPSSAACGRYAHTCLECVAARASATECAQLLDQDAIFSCLLSHMHFQTTQRKFLMLILIALIRNASHILSIGICCHACRGRHRLPTDQPTNHPTPPSARYLLLVIALTVPYVQERG
jgi:hypothetical protein